MPCHAPFFFTPRKNRCNLTRNGFVWGAITVDHEKFARLRAEHYNMKEAMKLGQQLTEDEEDEDEDDD